MMRTGIAKTGKHTAMNGPGVFFPGDIVSGIAGQTGKTHHAPLVAVYPAMMTAPGAPVLNSGELMALIAAAIEDPAPERFETSPDPEAQPWELSEHAFDMSVHTLVDGEPLRDSRTDIWTQALQEAFERGFS